MKVMWPENVGIVGIEVMFPSQFIEQTEMEKFDEVSIGKYTIGLGQERMGLCSDREDINSLCLSVVSSLLERSQVKHSQIGHLEVGTETIIDKSKSVKTVLMQLFEPNGATDLEGIDTTNACYGGTAAVFNAINWVESSSWDGRLALVVCADIAVYAKGNARVTGGAGAVAMLIGPNAPLVLDRGLRASYMNHSYDFYKPNLSSEYPIVDGKYSIQCYLSAMDHCYQLYRRKFEKKFPGCSQAGVDIFDAIVFHTPFCKMVQKSVARLVFNDFLLTSEEKRQERFPGLEKFNNLKLEDTFFDRDVEKTFMTNFNNIFESKSKSSLFLGKQVGNMYTASLYSALVSYLINTDISDLAGKRIGLYSYGAGMVSTMYSMVVTSNVNHLGRLVSNLSYVKPQLESRQKISPEEYTRLLEVREKNNHVAPYKPSGSIEVLFPGMYYLKSIDELHRRTYERKPITKGC